MTKYSSANLTVGQLRQALAIREQIEELEKQLAGVFAQPAAAPVVTATVPLRRRKGGISAAGRARIAAAQRARWAKAKAAKTATPAKARKSGLSAAGRSRIIAAQRARWAKYKASKTGKAAKAS